MAEWSGLTVLCKPQGSLGFVKPVKGRGEMPIHTHTSEASKQAGKGDAWVMTPRGEELKAQDWAPW